MTNVWRVSNDAMEVVLDFLWSLKGYFYVGGTLVLISTVLLILGIKFIPEGKKVFWIIFGPLIGCGGCIFVVPFFMVFGALVLGMGVYAVCENSPAC
jgi:hypothetical protein